MKRLQCLLCFITLLCFKFATQAQTISYEYDNAGNRTERITAQLRQENTAMKKKQSQTINEELLVYPNPTDDFLSIEIPNIGNHKARIQIFNVAGTRVYSGETTSGKIDINLNNKPAGIYLLRVELDKKIYIRKIVKN